MRKIGLIMAICAIITIGPAATLGAQQSNQNAATAGVFTTDVDDYMNVHSWSDVTFNKWFGYLGGSSYGNVNLGFATKISGIYLGAYYAGNILDSDTDERKTQTTTWNTDLQQLLTEQNTTWYGPTTTDTSNHISTLIGIAGMGIRLGFWEDMTTYNTPFNTNRGDTSTITKDDKGYTYYTNNDSINYEESRGDMVPYFQWGMKVKLGPGTLAPRVGASVDINRDTLIDEYYSTARIEYQGEFIGADGKTRVNSDYGYIGLDAAIGADYYFNDNFYIGVDYILGLKFNGKDYSGAGMSGTINGGVYTNAETKTTNYFDRTEKFESLYLNANENDSTTHTIVPALWKTTTVGENIKLGLLLQVPIYIGNETSSYYSDSRSVTESTYNDSNLSRQNRTEINESHRAGTKTETSSFGIGTLLGIGASYNLVPDRFTVNAGVTLYPIKYYRESRVTSGNGVSSEYSKTEIGSGDSKYTASETLTVDAPSTVTDSVDYNSGWTGLSGEVSAGFVFGFFNNFTMDLLVANRGFDISLTSLNVLFTFKF